MRKVKILIITAVIMLFSGCIPHTELDKQAIALAMGIDYSQGEYEVTVQYFNMEGAGGSSPIDPSKTNVITVSGKGETVITALESASVKCGRNFMYGITGIIVLGKAALTPYIPDTLSFAESYYQTNPTVLIAAADGNAKDIMDVKFKEGVVSVEHLRSLLDNAAYHGLCGEIKILQLLSDQRQKSTATALPLLKMTEKGSDATDDGKTVELTGGVLLSDGHYAGDLSLSELSGIQLMGEKPENSLICVEAEGEKVNVTVYDVTRDIDVRFTEKGLVFTAIVHANGKYTDSQLSGKDPAFSEFVEKECETELKRRISEAFGGTATAYGTDPFRLKYTVYHKDYPRWLEVKGSWGELLKTAELRISCDVDIDRFGITH